MNDKTSCIQFFFHPNKITSIKIYTFKHVLGHIAGI